MTATLSHVRWHLHGPDARSILSSGAAYLLISIFPII